MNSYYLLSLFHFIITPNFTARYYCFLIYSGRDEGLGSVGSLPRVPQAIIWW